jgi:hypothetical protein
MQLIDVYSLGTVTKLDSPREQSSAATATMDQLGTLYWWKTD